MYSFGRIDEAKNTLVKLFNEILEKREKGEFPSNKLITDIYNIVLDQCDKGDIEADSLYNLHTNLIGNFINNSVKSLKQVSSIDMINLIIEQINKINYIILTMNKTFSYLDRFYIKSKLLLSLDRKSFNLFKELFFIPLKEDIFSVLSKFFSEINKNDNEENQIKIKKIFKLINEIDNISNPKIARLKDEIIWKNEREIILNDDNKKLLFDEWFNNFLLAKIEHLIERKLKEFENLTIEKYLKSIISLNSEIIIYKNYFDTIYYNKISNAFYEAFIQNRKEEIENYFINIKRLELKNFYNSNKSSKACFQFICNIILYSLEKNNYKIFENKELKILEKNQENKFPKICAPIEFKNQIEQLFSDCFDNKEPEYRYLLFKINKIILNKKNFSYSKELAFYTDYCMRIKFQGKSEEEINNDLLQIIQTFSLLINKIDFQLLIEEKLSERLIKNSSLSLNIEKKFISMIKQEVGISYAQKMVGMINDLDLSKKENEEYKIINNNHLPNDIKFNVIIISQSNWNINLKYFEKMKIPPFLQKLTDDFTTFYKNRFDSRKLIWLNGLSRIEMQYLCFKNIYKSKSTLLQYLILLELEKFKKLSIKKIAENIGCNVNSVLNDIMGLISNPSFNINNKKDKGILLGNITDENKEFKETDDIWINFDFICPKLSFNTLPLTIKKNTNNEINHEKEVKKYQDNIIQSTIVRIMKGLNGKNVQHQWLINEVSKQILLFIAQPHQIKENIEKIIEKNIIKRDENDKSCYQYIA